MLLVLCLNLSVGAATAIVMPHLDDVPSTQSIFMDDVKFARDPFFPKSERWKPIIIIPTNAPPIIVVSPFAQVMSCIVLKGISGVPAKRLAMLNNRTVAAGESTDIKCNNQVVKVRCVEIRPRSVVLGIEGSTETKEIHLRQGM